MNKPLPTLLDVDVAHHHDVLSITYTWDGALPASGPVSLITSIHPRNDPGNVRRFGIKWVDEAFSATYIHDRAGYPPNQNQPGSYTPGNGRITAQFNDELRDLGADLVWTAVICTEYDLEPIITGELTVA